MAWQHVGVEAERDADVGVADPLAQHLDWHPSNRRVRRDVAVAWVMQPDRWQAGHSRKPSELPTDPLRRNTGPLGLGEDQPGAGPPRWHRDRVFRISTRAG